MANSVAHAAVADRLHFEYLLHQQHLELGAAGATDGQLGLSLTETDDINLHTQQQVLHAWVGCEQNLCAGLD